MGGGILHSGGGILHNSGGILHTKRNDYRPGARSRRCATRIDACSLLNFNQLQKLTRSNHNLQTLSTFGNISNAIFARCIEQKASFLCVTLIVSPNEFNCMFACTRCLNYAKTTELDSWIRQTDAPMAQSGVGILHKHVGILHKLA